MACTSIRSLTKVRHGFGRLINTPPRVPGWSVSSTVMVASEAMLSWTSSFEPFAEDNWFFGALSYLVL